MSADRRMKVVFVPRKKGDLDLGLVFGGIGIFALAGLRFFPGLALLVPDCPFQRLTGIPCPTCGVTRCSILVSQFRVIDAFLVNPLFVTVCLGIAIWAIAALVFLIMKKTMQFHCVREVKPVIRFTVVFCIVMNWGYLILTGV